VPLLGRKRVSEIDAGDIERFVRDVAAGKTARDEKLGPRKRIIVRGGEGAGRKVVRDLSAVFSFAICRGITESNPVQRAAIRKTDNRRDRYLSLEEIVRLGHAFNELAKEGANAKAITIARLWALTGCRRDEIAALRWPEPSAPSRTCAPDVAGWPQSQRPLPKFTAGQYGRQDFPSECAPIA
jgi:integrase